MTLNQNASLTNRSTNAFSKRTWKNPLKRIENIDKTTVHHTENSTPHAVFPELGSISRRHRLNLNATFGPSIMMILFMVFIALFANAAYGCGRPAFPPVVNRVVAGQEALPHSWPWQVSLQSDRSGRWSHVCGGSLISADWVLTAAHCVNVRYSYRVQLGKHSLSVADEEGSLTVGAAKIVSHDDYNTMLSRNDIALIKLSSPVSFSDTVMAACLPDPGVDLPHGTPCYVSGWGRLSTSGPPADVLQQALLPVVGHATCSQADWWSVLATTKMVCAGGDGIKAGCNGDSGGPLNCQNPDGSWDVHGAVSFGSGTGCNVLQKPTVFTKVSSYISWINAVVSSH